MHECWKLRPLAWLLLAAAALACPATAASYGKSDAGDEVFRSPVRLSIEIPPDSLATLRAYNQVWRQKRPERIDVPVTVREGNRVYTNVAVHLKGSYSFQPIDAKPSLTLNFDKFAEGQKFHGLTKIHLNNSAQDPSYLSEQLARELFSSIGIPAPRAGQALVSINGRDIGLCVVLEGANKGWVKRNFASAKGNLYDGGSGGDLKALEVDAGFNPDDRTAITNLFNATKMTNLTARYRRLNELLDVEHFITFAAAEAFLGHWDGYAINGNNYRLLHDASRDKFVFIPSGMDQLFGVSSSPNFSITPPFKGRVAKALFAVPEARARYMERIEQLAANEFRTEALHQRVDKLAARVRPALRDRPALLDEFNSNVQSLKMRISNRTRAVAQQLKSPPRAPQLAKGGSMQLLTWTFKGGPTLSAMGSRAVENGRQVLRVTGRGVGSSGAWRHVALLGPGTYELVGQARTTGIAAEPGMTNGVILRISGERSVEGIIVSDQWVTLRYEFAVSGVEDVELICEFRGAQGQGMFDLSTLRLTRKEH